MCGQPGHKTQPHAWLTTSFLSLDGFKTERSFDCKLRGSLKCQAYFLKCYARLFFLLADVRSTGAGIKCLYCTQAVFACILIPLLMFLTRLIWNFIYRHFSCQIKVK